MYVGGRDSAYAELLESLWTPPQNVLVVEHDIEPTPRALRQALYCKCQWSISPYKGDGPDFETAGLLSQSLGFTRFRASLMREVPDAIANANGLNDRGHVCPPKHWKGLDGRVLHFLSLAGKKPHLHSEVPHHHRYHYGCACGREHP